MGNALSSSRQKPADDTLGPCENEFKLSKPLNVENRADVDPDTELLFVAPNGRLFTCNKNTRKTRWIARLTQEEAVILVQCCVRSQLAAREYPINKLVALNNIWKEAETLVSSVGCDKTSFECLKEWINETTQSMMEEAGENDEENIMKELLSIRNRLMGLSENLTQLTLKVDGVESMGNDTVRAKRKECVKRILAQADGADQLKDDLDAIINASDKK